MSFVENIYMPYFNDKVKKNGRNETFKILFEYLEKNNRKPVIVETGTTRLEHKQGGDGHATRIFDAYINCYDGECYSVDISEDACKCARSLVSSKTKVICSDSVKFLFNFDKPIDVLYLDSFDNVPDPTYSICASAIKLDETVLEALISCGLTIPANLIYSEPSVNLNLF